MSAKNKRLSGRRRKLPPGPDVNNDMDISFEPETHDTGDTIPPSQGLLPNPHNNIVNNQGRDIDNTHASTKNNENYSDNGPSPNDSSGQLIQNGSRLRLKHNSPTHCSNRSRKSQAGKIWKLCHYLRAKCGSCCHRNTSSTTASGKDRQSEGTEKERPLNIAQDNSSDINLLYEDEPFRKRVCRVCFTLIYVALATLAVFATYSMVKDLVVSVQNPVRSIHYKKMNVYPAPGIAVYPGGAEFLACGHYYNNVVTSKVRLTQLDLVNRNCSFTNLTYTDPHHNFSRNVLVISGPTSFHEREAIFLHFSLDDITRDFFTVSYFVFSNYAHFANSTTQSQADQIMHYHTYVPTFALSAGLRMWIKLILSETFLLDGTHHTNFDVEYSVVQFHDKRTGEKRKKHLFFIFFEWKNNIIEQSTLLYTTTPWSVLAGLCGVFLMLHRFYVLAQTSYRRVQKDKRRRTIRRDTLRRLRESRTMNDGSETPVFL